MTGRTIPMIKMPSGPEVMALGQGTWGMGEDPRQRAAEVNALRTGIDLGLTMIDTAEMYADGGTEELVGEAIAGRRDEVFLITKVLPANATRTATVTSCEQSLRRLGTDRIDLYLLHWRGPAPLDETVEALSRLMGEGRIRHWGVSNFDVPDLVELTGIAGGTAVETDQVLYNLGRRGIEWDLLPRCRNAGLPVLAYAPFERGRLLGHPVLGQVAERHGATPAQVGMAWAVRQDGVGVIAKAGSPEHVRQNRAALELPLTREDLVDLDRAFPPPTGPRPLEML